jgi:hypothetical protein
MPFPLEQFFAALHLGVATILDLEPRRFCSVGTESMLGHNALKIHLGRPASKRLSSCLRSVSKWRSNKIQKAFLALIEQIAALLQIEQDRSQDAAP